MKNLMPITLRVNGENHDLLVPPWRTLLEVLNAAEPKSTRLTSTQAHESGMPASA